MTKLFGTDGIRGEAGKFPLDVATIKTVGASLASQLRTKLGRDPLIVLGRDTRESGPWIEKALLAGIEKAGGEFKTAGVITTPGVAYLARTLRADAGIVISASHNPFSDNGVKIFAPSGRKIDEATERQIETDIAAGTEPIAADPADDFVASDLTDDDGPTLRAQYLDFLKSEVGLGLSLNGLRIVVDCANGAASRLAPELFTNLGASVITINADPNGRNINLGCGSLHMEGLQEQVVKRNAHLGVALDGDADRALFVDAEGQVINGDATLWVLANYLQARGRLEKNTVVATVMSNIGLEIALRSRGIDLVRTDVGDKYVLDELVRIGGSLGGEQSGHIIFPQVSLAGDGLITTLCLLRAMTEEGKSIHELTAEFKTFPQILINVEVKIKRPFAEIPAIQNMAQDIETILGDRGRLLLRYSGTEPLARIMLEGDSQEQIEEHANELAGVIKKTLGR